MCMFLNMAVKKRCLNIYSTCHVHLTMGSFLKKNLTAAWPKSLDLPTDQTKSISQQMLLKSIYESV